MHEKRQEHAGPVGSACISCAIVADRCVAMDYGNLVWVDSLSA